MAQSRRDAAPIWCCLTANPLEGLATLRRPQAVIAGGRVLDRATLDRLESSLFAERPIGSTE